MYCKTIVKNDFTGRWAWELCNIERNPKLRVYRTIKYNFGREPYIDLVNDEPLKTLKTENRHDSILVAIDDVL